MLGNPRHLMIAFCILWIGDASTCVHGQAAARLQTQKDTVSTRGQIRLVSGNLIYVEGLTEWVPLGSTLAVSKSSVPDATYEVIKHLDGEVVAYQIRGDTRLRVGQTVRVVEPGDHGTRHPRRVAVATRVDRGPAIDGNLSEPVWERALPIDSFVQREPEYWMPGTDHTVARILYDEDHLYIGFDCESDTPDRIVANNMRRDVILSGDDHVSVLLDTYNDRQNGYFFFVNPHGTQRDLLLSNEGRTSNENWDANWSARTRLHDRGWSVEMRIPFDQLRFKEGGTTWGLNLGRGLAAKNEELQLVVGTRSSSGRARYWTSDIAELRGMGEVRSKRLLQVKPYALPGTSKDIFAVDPTQQGTFESGADLRYGITSNLTLDLSYNTDFAQVEGDQEQVNLTQFSLFFPEKREFFLEGANVFDFGEAAVTRGGDSRPPTLLFYSRRIGLEDDRQVPITLGSKLAGKMGRTSVGVLNALTDEAVFREDGGEMTVPRSNFSVVRMRQDLGARSNVGFIYVNKQTRRPGGDWDDYNRAGGVDLSYSPNTRLNLQAFAARTWDSNVDPGNAVWGRVDYRGSLVDWRAVVLDVEDSFEPDVGFVNRRGDLEGFRRYEGRFRVEPRPRAWGINSIRFGVDGRAFTDRDNDLKNANASFGVSVENNRSDDFDIEVNWERDEVTEPFTPSDRNEAIEVPSGTYDLNSVQIGMRTSRNRKLQGEVGFEAGGFYTGSKYTLSIESAFKPSGQFNLEWKYETNWLRMPDGNASVQLFNTRVIYSFTTDFFIKLFAQWNNEDQFASFNILASYRYRPGSDVFVVYDQGFGTVDGFDEQNRAFLLKWTYLISL